jgi:hypothetical protein
VSPVRNTSGDYCGQHPTLQLFEAALALIEYPGGRRNFDWGSEPIGITEAQEPVRLASYQDRERAAQARGVVVTPIPLLQLLDCKPCICPGCRRQLPIWKYVMYESIGWNERREVGNPPMGNR